MAGAKGADVDFAGVTALRSGGRVSQKTRCGFGDTGRCMNRQELVEQAELPFAGAYLSISEAQFRTIDNGAALGSSNLVLIRNFWPSAVTS